MDISDSALFKGMLSEAEFAFAFFDGDGRVQRVNDVFSDVVSVPAERLVGRLPVEVLAADLSQIITHAV
ncbi:PAS domain-containing protein, partial [Nonomuraea sp. NPDC049624]|uniref:PAS domain-containing protein n=1 Tax=Nonomuraea sp. NPDC049624 TaxID=3154354 RepID=UPI00343476ED